MLVRHVCGFSLAMFMWQIKHALPFMTTSNPAAPPHSNERQIEYCMNTNGWDATARLITLIWSSIHKQFYHMLLTNCFLEDKGKKDLSNKKQATYTLELEHITKACATKSSWVIRKLLCVCECVSDSSLSWLQLILLRWQSFCWRSRLSQNSNG